MKRNEFSNKTKREAWDRSGFSCEACGTRLVGKPVEYHHANEDYFGGSNSLDNCRVLCVGCHDEITRARAGDIAKSRRIRNKEAGIKKPSRFACSKDSKWKKRLDGTVVPR